MAFSRHSPLKSPGRKEEMGVPLDALGLRARQEVEAAVQDLILETKCPICLDFFTNPRSAPCQHNFCEVWQGRRGCDVAPRASAPRTRALAICRAARCPCATLSALTRAGLRPTRVLARVRMCVRASGSAGVYLGVYQGLAQRMPVVPQPWHEPPQPQSKQPAPQYHWHCETACDCPRCSWV
jgi:hypothetical protein